MKTNSVFSYTIVAKIFVSLRLALREHWPEYLIEGWALGSLMTSIGSFVTVLESPKSALYALVPSSILRAVLLALAIGVTITLLIQSPWGKRSGAHMNPAITLAFLRLKRIRPWDALFFIFAQPIGGMLGVIVVILLGRHLFTDPPGRYAVTTPGSAGEAVAFMCYRPISRQGSPQREAHQPYWTSPCSKRINEL